VLNKIRLNKHIEISFKYCMQIKLCVIKYHHKVKTPLVSLQSLINVIRKGKFFLQKNIQDSYIVPLIFVPADDIMETMVIWLFFSAKEK
jgi:hypothetical protein